MTHQAAWERLPDLLSDRDDHELLAHVDDCHLCQAQLFRLTRVDRMLRASACARRRVGSRARIVAVAAALTAVAAAAAIVVEHGGAPAARAQFDLRTASGAVVARASVGDGDSENESVALVAHGLPARPADTYALWTRTADGRRAVLVGRFMVSHRGECRARFNLPGRRHPSRFWITPAQRPARVVATT